LDAQPLPASTELLRDRIAAPIPTSELPEALLEVDAWTGFSQKLVPGTARSADLALSICAALLVQVRHHQTPPRRSLT